MALTEFLLAFVPLWVIVDPPASLGLFMGLTAEHSRPQRMRIAAKACLFAAGVLAVFMLTGRILLEFLGVEIYALQVAGGLLLVITGLKMLREGRQIARKELMVPTGGNIPPGEEPEDPSFVPLGLPMLAGPGAISLVIVLTTDFGLGFVSLSIGATMLSAFLMLAVVARFQHVMGDTSTRIITRIMGIIVVAVAVQYILNGIDGWQAAA